MRWPEVVFSPGRTSVPEVRSRLKSQFAFFQSLWRLQLTYFVEIGELSFTFFTQTIMHLVQWNLVNTVTEWAQKKWPYWRGFFFLHENVWRFLPGDQKKWPCQRGDRKAGFHCIFHVGDVSATEFGVKNKPSEIAKIFWMTKKDKMRNPEILFQSLAY